MPCRHTPPGSEPPTPPSRAAAAGCRAGADQRLRLTTRHVCRPPAGTSPVKPSPGKSYGRSLHHAYRCGLWCGVWGVGVGPGRHDKMLGAPKGGAGWHTRSSDGHARQGRGPARARGAAAGASGRRARQAAPPLHFVVKWAGCLQMTRARRDTEGWAGLERTDQALKIMAKGRELGTGLVQRRVVQVWRRRLSTHTASHSDHNSRGAGTTLADRCTRIPLPLLFLSTHAERWGAQIRSDQGSRSQVAI